MYQGFNLIYFTSVSARYIDDRSQSKVHNDKRAQVNSAQSSMVVTHPSTNYRTDLSQTILTTQLYKLKSSILWEKDGYRNN